MFKLMVHVPNKGHLYVRPRIQRRMSILRARIETQNESMPVRATAFVDFCLQQYQACERGVTLEQFNVGHYKLQ
jgi:hypothetical protein